MSPAEEPQRAVKQGAVSQPAAASTSRLPCICESVPAAQARTSASLVEEDSLLLRKTVDLRQGGG